MIGIISGMGPFAGTHLLQEINYRTAQANPRGISFSDFPEVVMHQVPFANTTFLGDTDVDLFQETIANSARKLAQFGATRIVLASNTHDRMAQKIVDTTTGVEYLSVTTELHHAMRNHPAQNVLFLGSNHMRQNTKLILPNKTIDHPDQILVNHLIRQAVIGKTDPNEFHEVIAPYPDHLIVLGSTELHPYFRAGISQPAIDSIDTITERILA